MTSFNTLLGHSFYNYKITHLESIATQKKYYKQQHFALN
jgi:hypothetical protein